MTWVLNMQFAKDTLAWFAVNPCLLSSVKTDRKCPMCSFQLSLKIIKSSMYAVANELQGFKTTSMARWNSAGAFFSPKGMRAYL